MTSHPPFTDFICHARLLSGHEEMLQSLQNQAPPQSNLLFPILEFSFASPWFPHWKSGLFSDTYSLIVPRVPIFPSSSFHFPSPLTSCDNFTPPPIISSSVFSARGRGMDGASGGGQLRSWIPCQSSTQSENGGRWSQTGLFLSLLCLFLST